MITSKRESTNVVLCVPAKVDFFLKGFLALLTFPDSIFSDQKLFHLLQFLSVYDLSFGGVGLKP